jgi:site-specific DNA-methyltransferase (adenine-specific)
VFELSTGRSRIVLHNADCLAGMKEHLRPGTVDIVVTSPPYNLGIRYKTYDDTAPRDAYLRWLGEWADAVKTVLADDGSLFLNLGSMPSDPYVPFDALGVMRSRFVLQNTIHWIKSIAISKADVGDYPGLTGDVAVGHYKPINSRRYVNDCHEYIFHLTKRGDVELDRLGIGVPYQDKTNVARWAKAGGGLRCRGNTWFIPYKTIKFRDRERPHPATFPVQLPERCIRLHGLERTRLVLDPFLGLGHTALACRDLGVDFVGFEIDPHYFAAACRALKPGGELWG